ncbi:aldose 1-epimerase family protein [Ethanoligenens harbinense]|uniref:Aldose 1-epimerase n=1 Tax=Ethanoligenens harbinense (strain DSM 18485 / JCM 12961 / CGMCC 1.5033 / YUAN-3) TaxID=663278 RepID=E6U4S7_ETHHY|nr:aldose 1-epimerase family protein [Ethanoligenens harbinense]ADU27812.1 Aldose 1-epimerase [Ethanoligenens harbinense YUAN-3]AVQ96837.1 protein lacX [Ethanoligenens harbinense YUAN-3]AYF39499.1 protein lacX [Ethanoligenens harbinense]AYF42324.1 protein lacX [Ethanoligenens harbinense]QCN93078.1 aldose 1-epimerase family protein [Ethanoligenens harbinense]
MMDYTLKNEYVDLKLSAYGGQLTSIKANAIEYLWQGDAAYWSGQAPILFPIVGSLRNKEATVGKNKTCHMERHGVARKQNFDMIACTGESISFSFDSNESTLSQFPYRFHLIEKYVLHQNSIEVQYIVQNTGDGVLPFQIGGHPGFNCPLLQGERFEDYQIEFEYPETADCPQIVPDTGLVDVENRRRVLTDSKTLPLKHSLFYKDALIFDRLKSRNVKLRNPHTGHYVALSFHDFNNLLIWSSSNDGPFVALEPWSGLATCSDESDVFEEKRGIYLLEPRQMKSFSHTITVG